MPVRITTKLNRDAVLTSLRDLVMERSLVDLQSRFEGRADRPDIVVAYRASAIMSPALRVATFFGRVVNSRDGAVIEGRIEVGAIVWLAAIVLFSGSIAAVARALRAQDFAEALGVLAIALGVLGAHWAYVASTKRFIVNEICRASRGSVA
jgi:hypothetical protein